MIETKNVWIVIAFSKSFKFMKPCLSTSKYVTDSDEYEEMMPKVIVNLKILDPSRNIFWYPSILQTTKGYVFPELSAEDWHWFSAPIVEIEEKDMDKLPPGSDGKIGDLVIALWLGKQFGKYKFYEACESLGLMIDRHENIEEEDETSNAT